MSYTIYIWIILAFSILAIIVSGIRIVRPVEKGLVETFGKWTRTAEQGFSWIIPVVQRMNRVNITEIRVDVEPQNIITKDKLNAEVDAVVYYKIKEVKKAIYNVNDFVNSVPSLARTTLRAVVGKMTLANANENRDEINQEVEKELDRQTDQWGIDIIRVELQKIEPPKDVQNAMNEVVKAENEKIAALDFATSVETKADGEKRAAIKSAEGIAKGKIIVAQAEATKIKLVHEAANKYFIANAQKLKQLEVTENSLKDNTKVVLTEKGISPNIILGEIPIKTK